MNMMLELQYGHQRSRLCYQGCHKILELEYEREKSRWCSLHYHMNLNCRKERKGADCVIKTALRYLNLNTNKEELDTVMWIVDSHNYQCQVLKMPVIILT